MKIQLNVSEESYAKIKQMLLQAGFVIDDDAEFVLTQRDRFLSYIPVKNQTGEKVRISGDEIIFIESFGHDVLVHTNGGGEYLAFDRLYQLCGILDNTKFLRVSNCAIIAKAHVRKIKPSLSMKFILTMSDGSLVDVTRSYCSAFREFFHI